MEYIIIYIFMAICTGVSAAKGLTTKDIDCDSALIMVIVGIWIGALWPYFITTRLIDRIW